MMALVLEPATVPLREDSDGTLRVGVTRVTLDIVVGDWLDGATAEEIVHAYPVLELADVYYVIGFYLAHRDKVTNYLDSQRADAAALRREIEAKFPTDGLRARLLSRREKSSVSI